MATSHIYLLISITICIICILLPAAPVAPRWFDEPNWYDYVPALDLQHLPEDDHALVWYPDENHWE